jgi:hypothetical protein
LRFIRHVHLDETPLPYVIFQKLCESNNVEDLTFRRGREASDAALSEETCKYIGQLLQSQTNLWHFALDCRVEEAGWQHICQGLHANHSLQEVDVSFGSIHAAEQLGKGIAASKSIKKLTISGKYSTSDVALKLLEKLKDNASLTEVSIENVFWNKCAVLLGLQHVPAAARIKLLNVKMVNVTEEELEGLKLCKSIELEMTESLDNYSIGPVMEGLAHNRCIKKLLLGIKDGLLSNAAGPQFGNMLKQNEVMADLSIIAKKTHRYRADDFCITTGFAELCKGLMSNNSLTKLDLSDCGIRDDLKVLSEVLMYNNTLESVNLSFSYLGDTNLEKFCEALKTNTGLRTLNLSNCKLSPGAMQNFAKALQVNRTLTDIDLSIHSPEFTDEMYPLLCNAIKTNTALKKVVLGTHQAFYHNNYSNKVTLTSVADLVKHNTSITSLHLTSDMCRFPSQEGVLTFIEALKVNTTLTSLRTGVFWENPVSKEQVADIFSSNYSLLEADFSNFHVEMLHYLLRNADNRKRTIGNTMVLCENIFRSQEAMDLLPPELWMNIFAQLKYPGIESMAPLIQLFINYRNSKYQ